MLVLVVPAPAAVTSAGGDPVGADAEHRGHHRALALLTLALAVVVLWLVVSDPSPRPAS